MSGSLPVTAAAAAIAPISEPRGGGENATIIATVLANYYNKLPPKQNESRHQPDDGPLLFFLVPKAPNFSVPQRPRKLPSTGHCSGQRDTPGSRRRRREIKLYDLTTLEATLSKFFCEFRSVLEPHTVVKYFGFLT